MTDSAKATGGGGGGTMDIFPAIDAGPCGVISRDGFSLTNKSDRLDDRRYLPGAGTGTISSEAPGYRCQIKLTFESPMSERRIQHNKGIIV